MIKKKSIATQWLISYILLLIIPIIISGVIFAVLERDVRDETYEMNNMVLSPIKNDVDNHLYTLKRVYTELVMDATFKKTVNGFRTNYSEGLNQANKLRQEAKVFVTSNDVVNAVYISFDSSDIALYTQSGVHDRESINKIVFDDKKAQELSQFIEENPNGGFFDLKIVSEDKPRNTICYVGTFDETHSAKNGGVVIVCADMNYIESRISDMMGAMDTGFVMLDGKNQTVFETRKGLKVDETKREKAMYEDKDNVLSFVEFEMSDWCGVAVSPKKMFWKRLSMTRTLCGVSLVLSLVLGGICAWYILKRNYKPVESVVSLLADKRKKAEKNENEYAFLLETLSDMLKNESDTNLLVDKQNDALRRNFFIGLLYGNHNIKTPDEIINKINFLSDSCIVVIFDVLNSTELFSKEEEDGRKNQETAQFIITNIMTELIGKYHLCYMVDMGKELVGIVSISPHRNEPERDVLEALNIGCSAIEENFNLMVNVVVGRICEGVDKICEGYRESLEVLEYANLAGISGIIQCQEFFVDDYYYCYPPNLDVQLVNAIKTGAKDTAAEILEEIFKTSLKGKKLSAGKTKYLVLEIVSTLLKVVNDENERKKIADICYMQEDMVQAKEKLFATVLKLCDENFALIQESGTGIEMKVCDYIDEHYREQSLTIQELGDKFGLAPYYLSRNFKSKMGVGIAEHIRKIRVQKAKEIMSENEFIRLEEVAETVGLNGTRALTRAFKQELGILPGEYRKMLNKDM